MAEPIAVQGMNRAGEAVIWAQAHFGDAFEVRYNFPSDAYFFTFQDAGHAVLFGLKWL